MQKSGKFFWEILPKTIVPLDSAVVFTLYATYYNALHTFRQYVFSMSTIIYHCPVGWWGYLITRLTLFKIQNSNPDITSRNTNVVAMP